MNLIIAICLFISVLAGRLAYDTWLYQSRKVNKHRAGPIITAGVIVVCSWLAGWLSLPMWGFGFWFLFNVLYNRLIGQKWDFVGTTAGLDKLERRWPWIKWFRIAGFIISLIIYFYAH